MFAPHGGAQVSWRNMIRGIFSNSDFRALRSKLALRLALTVFLSIAVVEAVVLIPSYRNYERDLLERLAHAGNAAVMAMFTSHAHASERDLGHH